jgi:hypothetical protein
MSETLSCEELERKFFIMWCERNYLVKNFGKEFPKVKELNKGLAGIKRHLVDIYRVELEAADVQSRG